jgi:hypothetical protein
MGNVFPYFLDEEAKPFKPKAVFHPWDFDFGVEAE